MLLEPRKARVSEVLAKKRRFPPAPAGKLMGFNLKRLATGVGVRGAPAA